MQQVSQIRCRTDFDKFVIVSNFERRQWSKVEALCASMHLFVTSVCSVPHGAQIDEDDWDFYWASVTTVKQVFSPENTVRLEPHQIINHFPNHYELTRKASSVGLLAQCCMQIFNGFSCVSGLDGEKCQAIHEAAEKGCLV